MTEFYPIDSEYAVHGDEDAIYGLVRMATTYGSLGDVIEPVTAGYMKRKLLREAETASCIRDAGKLD